MNMSRISFSLRLCAAAISVAALSACAIMGKQPTTADMVKSSQLNLPQAAGQTLAQWPHEGWWKQYHDATLNDLVDRAVANGPSLRVLATRIEAAHNAADAVKKLAYPSGQIKAEWSGSENFNTHIDKDDPVRLAMIPNDPDNTFVAMTTISAGLSWNLDLWGHNRALYHAALGQERAQTYEYEAARQSVIASIVGLHAQIVALQARTQLIDDEIATQNILHQRWQEREQAGLQPIQNSIQTDMTIVQLNQQKQSLLAQKMVARAQLAALVGQTPTQLAESFPSDAWLTLNLPEVVPAQILGSRPDIAAAREYIKASTAQVAATKAEFYPDINLGVSTALQLVNVQHLLDFRGQSVGVKPAITLPIFNTIQLNAQLRQQQAQLNNTIAQYNKTVFDAVSDASQQLAQYRQAKAYLAQQERMVDDQQKLTALSEQRYRAGMAPQMESLSLKTAVLRERDALASGYAMRRAQEARLASSLGIGFSDLVRSGGKAD